MDDFELELKGDFIQEALLNLEDAEESFMELESSQDPSPLLDKIFRLAHNLKGGSRAVGFGQVAEFTHELENLVLKLKNKELGLSSEIVTVLLRSNDRLAEMLAALRDDMAAEFDNSDLITALTSCKGGASAPAPNDSEAAPSEEVQAVEAGAMASEIESMPPPADAFGDIESVPAEAPSAAPDPVESTPAPAPAPQKIEAKSPKSDSSAGGGNKSEKKEDEIVRVGISKIESLNDLAGELIVLQSMIQQQSQIDLVSTKLSQSIQQMTKLVKDIQGLSMGMRMLPIKPLVRKLTRTVRDTADALHKAVKFEIEGEQIEVDKSVLDNLGDPLIHILRNAVDHGLEDMEDRLNGPKDPEGSEKLSFSNEGNFLVVQVKDDGKGIDPGVIRSKAIEKGLITEREVLTDGQISEMLTNSIQKVNEIVEKTTRKVDQLVEIGKDKASLGQSTAEKCREALANISANAKEVEGMVAEIANASKEQAQGVQEINKAISQLDQVTQQNTSVAQNGSVQAEKLSQQSQELQAAVSVLELMVTGKQQGQVQEVKGARSEPNNVVAFGGFKKSSAPSIKEYEVKQQKQYKKASGSDFTPSSDDSEFEDF